LEEIQTAYYMVAATGVLVAAIYYIFNMRATLQTRREANMTQQQQIVKEEANKKIQLTNTMLQTLYKEEVMRSFAEILNYKWTDDQDFLNKYDSSVNPDSFAKRTSIFYLFETLGYLLKQGAIDKELIYINGGSSVIFLWAKFKPIIEMYRKLAYGSDSLSYFEYFASEMWRMKKARDSTLIRDQTTNIDFRSIFE